MSLLDTRKYGKSPNKMRKFKRRRRTGIFVISGLAVLVVGFLAFSWIVSALGGGSETVERVQAPAVEEAPAAVSEEPAAEVRAEEDAARQRAADREQERERASEEKTEE